MIQLRFEGASGSDTILGLAPWFRIAGNFIRQGPHGAIVGKIWHVHETDAYWPVMVIKSA
jgi:hypothetical protein